MNGQKKGAANQITQVRHSKPDYDRKLRFAKHGILYGFTIASAVQSLLF